MKFLLTATLLCAFAAPAFAQSASSPTLTTLAALKDHARVLLVFSPDASDERTVSQLEVTEESLDALKQRDVFVAYLSTAAGHESSNETSAPAAPALTATDAALTRKRFHITPKQFTVILLGKDGGEKLRSPDPVTIEQLSALIDAMPMRQQEVRQRSQSGGRPR